MLNNSYNTKSVAGRQEMYPRAGNQRNLTQTISSIISKGVAAAVLRLERWSWKLLLGQRVPEREMPVEPSDE